LDLSAVEDVRAVDDGKRLAHGVVGDEDAQPFRTQEADDLLDVRNRDRVDAGEGLVEQEKRGVGRDRARDLYPAALPAGERLGPRLRERLQTELREEPRQPAFLLVGRHAALFPDEAQVISHRKPAEDRRLLAEIADAFASADVDRLVGDIRLGPFGRGEQHAAAVGAHEPDDHVERRGLSGAVRPQEPDDFARVYLKADMVHDRARSIALRQRADVDRAHLQGVAQGLRASCGPLPNSRICCKSRSAIARVPVSR
jgi:hypothetical protein